MAATPLGTKTGAPGSRNRVFDLLYFTGDPFPCEHYIAFGWTAGEHFHAVVMQDGELAHDPGYGATALARVTHTYRIIPRAS